MARVLRMSVALLAWLFVAAGLPAAYVRTEVAEQSDVLGGKSFGSSGPYIRIVGRVYFSVDPKLPANRIICDIDLAPRNPQGLVEFSADLYVLRPRDPKKGNGTVLFEVSNRGRKGLLSTFNLASGSLDPRNPPDFGDEYLMNEGYTLAWLGWQFDTPPEPNLMRFYTAVAKGVRGVVRGDFVPDEKTDRIYVADRTHIPYPVADPRSLQLTVRAHRDDPRQMIPPDQWQLDPDRTHITMKAGFLPGRIYEFVYTAEDAGLAGLGPAAIRDWISHLKADPESGIKRAIAIGSSQSGRFLRTFLYYGFNQNESGKRVIDGLWAHVAGAGRGSFNHRFAQPSRDARPFFNFFYPVDLFPFTNQMQTDPETGISDSLLARAEKAGVVPRIFYTNTSYEYYGRVASLSYTTIDGRRDLLSAENTRIYMIAGGQHGPGAFPPAETPTQNPSNANDYRWAMRALLAAMNRWITDDTQPPPSLMPRISDGTLVPLSSLRFPKIPGVALPTRIHQTFRVDYGPDFRTKGIVTIDPPKIGKPFPVLVPQVEADGNETSGIRLPVIQAPLGTYTGWNLRAPKIRAPDELFSFTGSYIPFARTKAERQRTGDPRLSIEERYKDRTAYMRRVEASARALAASGYVLAADVPKIVQQAGAQWDATMKNVQPR